VRKSKVKRQKEKVRNVIVLVERATGGRHGKKVVVVTRGS
jgi:hypothetical protein